MEDLEKKAFLSNENSSVDDNSTTASSPGNSIVNGIDDRGSKRARFK